MGSDPWGNASTSWQAVCAEQSVAAPLVCLAGKEAPCVCHHQLWSLNLCVELGLRTEGEKAKIGNSCQRFWLSALHHPDDN